MRAHVLPLIEYAVVCSLQAAIANLRPATMELGGKSSLIIFDDAGGNSRLDLGKVQWIRQHLWHWWHQVASA
jgi:hypothetical protein